MSSKLKKLAIVVAIVLVILLFVRAKEPHEPEIEEAAIKPKLGVEGVLKKGISNMNTSLLEDPVIGGANSFLPERALERNPSIDLPKKEIGEYQVIKPTLF